MRHWFLYMCIIFCGLSFVWAQTDNSFKPDSLFIEANRLYSEQQFEEAFSAYKDIIDEGYLSPELFLNAGNAAYKSKRIGWSVLFYEKGLLLDSSDEGLNFNLNIVHQQVKDKVETSNPLKTWWINFVNIGGNTWPVLSIIFSFLAFGILILYRFRMIASRTLSLGLFGFFALLLTLTLYLVYEHNRIQHEVKYGVILEKRTGIKDAPMENGENLFFLHEGSKVNIRSYEGEWIEIDFGGNVGWVNKNALGEI